MSLMNPKNRYDLIRRLYLKHQKNLMRLKNRSDLMYLRHLMNQLNHLNLMMLIFQLLHQCQLYLKSHLYLM
jgi:hypothetical protein